MCGSWLHNNNMYPFEKDKLISLQRINFNHTQKIGSSYLYNLELQSMNKQCSDKSIPIMTNPYKDVNSMQNSLYLNIVPFANSIKSFTFCVCSTNIKNVKSYISCFHNWDPFFIAFHSLIRLFRQKRFW